MFKTIVDKTYRGFILLNNIRNEVINCEQYYFLRDFYRSFKYAFYENKELKNIWNTKSEKDRNELIIEAAEYFILDRLASCLFTYFIEGHRTKNTKELQRNDIKNLLSSNRFLELFSKPIEQRSSFLELYKSFKENKEIKRVSECIIRDKFKYKEFKLILPKNTKIGKENGIVYIMNKNFQFAFRIIYKGYTHNLPRDFLKYYCGYKNELININCHTISLEILSRFNPLRVFFKRAYNDYKWIEPFLSKLEKEFFGNSFIDSLNWDQIHAQTKVIENMMIKKKSRYKTLKSSKSRALSKYKPVNRRGIKCRIKGK